MTPQEMLNRMKDDCCNDCDYGRVYCKNMYNCDIFYCDDRESIKTLEKGLACVKGGTVL